MASNEDIAIAMQSDSGAQSASVRANLDAARARLTKILDPQTPHNRRGAIGEVDNYLAIIEKWVQREGDSASTIQAEITELKVMRNAALPIHTLPRETLTSILLIRLDPLNWSFRIISRFMSVCSSWKSLLENGWMFWPRLRSRYSPRLLELVLSRNVSGPLHIVCSKAEEEHEKLSFLELAADHSIRWCNLTFAGVVSDAVTEQLRVPTLNLTELNVCNTCLELHHAVINLSEGKPLHHLLLHGVGIPWDTPRLQGLRSIQLNRLNHNPPSLAQLYTILSSSPQLWYLRLSGIGQGSKDPGDTQSVPSGPIFLPALSTLTLRSIPEYFMSHLLTRIQAPACRCIVAVDILFSVASTPSFQNLITPALRASDGIKVTWNGASVSVTSERRPIVRFNWINLIEETVGVDISLSGGASSMGSKDDIQSLLETVAAHALSKLTVSFAPFSDAPPIMTAPGFLRLLPSANAIECRLGFDCRTVLQFLATEEGGDSGVPCPELERFTVAPRADTEMDLLRALLQVRQTASLSSSERAGSPVKPLKAFCAPLTVLDALGSSGLLEGLKTFICP